MDGLDALADAEGNDALEGTDVRDQRGTRCWVFAAGLLATWWHGKTPAGEATGFSLRRVSLVLLTLGLALGAAYLVLGGWERGPRREQMARAGCIDRLHAVAVALSAYSEERGAPPTSLDPLRRAGCVHADTLKCPATGLTYEYNRRYALPGGAGRGWVVRCRTPAHAGLRIRLRRGEFEVVWPRTPRYR
jgi:hypothetical protein